MELCVMIEGQEGVTWPQWVAIARACEEHGIPALFRSDHYLPLQGGSAPVLDAWACVSALAAVTSTLRLGTLVSPTTFRHPAVLAKMAATADHISDGRVELGIGAGWHAGEHEAFGLEFGTLGSRMDEFASQLEAVRSQLDGRFLPGPTGPLPIIVGGRAKPRSVALAARFADEYNTVFATPDECRERRATLERAWADAGRSDLRLSLMTGAVLGRDRGEVEERARLIGERRGEPGFTPADAWITGTPDEAHEQLGALADAGVERVMLQLLLHDDVDQVELVGELNRGTG
jgi:alkanesulfonate monooxygenase SsuD/methylene tetrahydromethanopterin reductase-like flavin-dependent oxidoreductase (luciferase family)